MSFPRLRLGAKPSLLRHAGALVAGVLLAGCVAYDEQTVTLAATARALPRLSGPLTFADAVEFAFVHNPELLALAAQARAAGLDIAAADAQVQLQDRRLALMIDPLALLGVVQRGASIDAARARGEAAAMALAQARWQTAAAIAEVFAASRALAEHTPPKLAVPIDSFVAAGLASPAAAAEARAAASAADAELGAIAAERTALRTELVRLLGASPDSDPQLAPPPADWPPLREPAADALHGRPDLTLALADYRAADAEFRKAVADQYPSLMIGPDFPLGAGAIEPMAILRLPLDATGPAHAARERREATRHRVSAALLTAWQQAAAADATHAAAELRARAARDAAAATSAKLRAAQAALAVEVDAFETFADRAPMAVREAIDAREAALAAARSRVRRAVAYGWPAEAPNP